MKITYLKNKDIDFVKWDHCINNAHNGNIYAFSWYLDIICEEWEALVHDDYEAVMPIVHKKKAKFRYTYTDILSQQLGVFSTDLLDEQMVNAFVKKLAEVYPLFTVNLNKYNKLTPSLFGQEQKTTYEFDLIGSYESVRRNYSEEVREAVNGAKKEKITVIKNIRPNDFLNLVQGTNVMATSRPGRDEINRLRRIIAFVLRHGLGEIYVAYTPENNLCAACLFLKSNRKTNVLYSAITRDGLSLNAMHFLMDYYIKKHTERILTLNFENLVIPDREEFCEGFGGQPFHYLNVFNNQLPFFQQLIFKWLR